MGLAYRAYAQAEPQLYRLMFDVTRPRSGGVTTRDLAAGGGPPDLPEGSAAFRQLVDAVRRIMAAGRIRDDDPVPVAGQIWSAIHGFVLLEQAGHFGPGDEGLMEVLAPLTTSLLVGLGDTPEAVAASLEALLGWIQPSRPPFRSGGPPQMTERKPPGVSFESWIDKQIREATERGDFDDLPGKGKPLPGMDEPYDELWWVKQKLAREQLSFLPPSLAVRKEVEDALAAVGRAHSETQVRRIVAEINEKILEALRAPSSGPPLNLTPLDAEDVVREWREQREERGRHGDG